MRKKALEREDYSETARRYAEEKLAGRLLEHTRGCVESAVKLARRFGVDEQKAAAASYLHDVAKTLTHEQQAAEAQAMGMSAAEIRSYPPPVLHGPLGALIAERELGIDDLEVLQAIGAHSTGCARMCAVAKVVFVADYIELTRSFPGATELRSRGHMTLDELTTAIVERKLIHLMEKRKIIDSRVLAFWNELVGSAE